MSWKLSAITTWSFLLGVLTTCWSYMKRQAREEAAVASVEMAEQLEDLLAEGADGPD